jgi:L-iditol 2-dehydrogenase
MEEFQLCLKAPGMISRTPLHLDTVQDTEVLVRVHSLGICATDLSLFSGTYTAPHKLPICFGHEWSGVVETVGAGVSGLLPGDRVVGECSLSCGHCGLCRHNPNLCRNIQKFGITTDGAARTHVIVQERFLHRAGCAVDMGVLALAEPLAVAARGVATALHRERPLFDGQRVLVLGGGMIGVACVAVLRLLHRCESVFLFDPIPSRCARARLFGAQALTTTDIPQGSPSNKYSDLYQSNGYDIIFETTGSPVAFKQSLQQLNPGGAVVHFGFLEEVTFAPKILAIKGAHMVGSIGGSGMFEAVLPLVLEHADTFRELITHTFAAADCDAAFASASDRQDSLKTQLVFCSKAV